MGIKRKFETTQTDQRRVDLKSGKYLGSVSWTNGKRGTLNIQDDKRMWIGFSDKDDLTDLRDLLNTLLEEIKEVPES